MLLQPFMRNVTAAPDRVAVIDDSGSYTNQRLGQMAMGLGTLIGRQTQRPTVGLLLPASAGFVAGFYGAMMAGKIAVPINFLLGAREVGHILTDSGIDTVLTIPFLAERLKGLPVNVVDITALPPSPETSAGSLAAARVPDARPTDIAVILYTSGTSGLPKGVILTHNNLQSDVTSAIDHAGLTDDHTFLGIVPLFHSTGLLATMLAPVQLGAKMVYVARFSPVATLKAIREHKVSVMVGVPSMYGALLRLKDAQPADFQQMYAPLAGGEPLPANIREAFRERFQTHIYEGYGLTETIGPVAFNTPQNHRAGSVGKLIPQATLKIVDDNDIALPGTDQTGEILLSGPMIMSGYYNLPEETDRVMTSDGFFRTGDLGHIDADGFLHVTGRKKDLIIVSGEKVYPRELEELLGQHPEIAEVAVLGRKDESRGEAVVAFVVAREGATPTLESVRDFLRQRNVVNWKIPKEVFVTKDLPRSPTGKVLKRELAQKLV